MKHRPNLDFTKTGCMYDQQHQSKLMIFVILLQEKEYMKNFLN